MDDLISRQAAIDAVTPTVKSIMEGNSFKGFIVVEKLRELPSVQPERKKGKWIEEPSDRETGYGGLIVCSECCEEGNLSWDFCPNCGTDMRDRQRATWELDEKSNRHRCSECLSVASRDDNGAESMSDYCGVCGARMEKS